VKYVLSGLQETNYPIAYGEQKMVLYEYMELLWNPNAEKKERQKITEKDLQNLRIKPKNFVGPSSCTLELPNIMPVSENTDVPNIHSNFTVTEKADGDRKLLYIAPDSGKIYLINTNMSVQFTGAVTRNKDLFNTLLDGEHILYNKERKFINLYTAFDIYYLKGENIRMKAFIPSATPVGEPIKKEKEGTTYRLPLLVGTIKRLLPESVLKNKSSETPIPSPLRIEYKTFYSADEKQTIFQGCDLILKKVTDGLFEYNTDGLIFTPTHLGVGANKIGENVKPIKSTWKYSFKWKPVEQNTIDFLISVKKLANGNDYIGSKFESGIDVKQSAQLTQYKTVILRVGFDENKHGYINPCQDVIEDKLPIFTGDIDDEDTYKPMQFYPTQPSDPTAGICNILLENGLNDDKLMMTEAGEVIEDNMIVEFSYDMTKEEQWRWNPLKVRYDKTEEFLSGAKTYGNAYHVANSNWHTIHNPITKEMITTGLDIPSEIVSDDEVYYNRTSSKNSTQSLRDFHNRYVKKSLLNSVAKRGDTLIDLAVGKGGDFPKWIGANLKFVFGIDISPDNIQNRLDGACARFLSNKKRIKSMPDALFVVGNSSVNIRSGNAIYSDKGKQITKAVFGEGAKDVKALGSGVYKEYGIAKDGFDICSIQFAIHYMFLNNDTLQNFLRNVSEVTKVGGYFIGTSYDGKDIFNMLKKVKVDESITITSAIKSEGESKIWEVTKRYNRNEFDDNISCLGYGIDVYQESINKTFREYLVNYDYLTQLLENYGFVLLKRDELKGQTVNESTGLFSDLFTRMNEDIKRNPRLARDLKEAPNMTAGERQISFLNRYFIYKKVRKVDTENVFLGLTNRTVLEEKTEEDETKRAQEEVLATVKTMQKATPMKIKGKTKKNIKLILEE
jgi:SAM-dependent methyltransferase